MVGGIGKMGAPLLICADIKTYHKITGIKKILSRKCKQKQTDQWNYILYKENHISMRILYAISMFMGKKYIIV